MSDFNITLFEVCELLNRSKKSISRYIRRGLLHPQEIKSKQGTLEYRFSKDDLEAFKAQEALKTDQARQDRADRTDRTEETRETGHTKSHFIENKGVLSETRQDTPEETGHERQDQAGHENEVMTLLKETTGLLKGQLVKKDEQIKDLGGKIDQLIERDRETNIILKSLQDKVFMLEQPKEPINGGADQTRQDKPEETRQDTPDQTGQSRQGIAEETGRDTGDGTEQNKEKPAKAGFWKRLFKSDL